MKKIFSALRIIVSIIALLVFAAGVTFTVLGGYDFVTAFSHWRAGHDTGILIGINLMHAVDLFLIAIVFFVLSIGILILFNNTDETFLSKLPEWLRIKDFLQLKVILWEAILTTLVVSYLAGLAERKIEGIEINLQSLIIPGAILLLALSLFFLKKGEK